MTTVKVRKETLDLLRNSKYRSNKSITEGDKWRTNDAIIMQALVLLRESLKK